MLCNKGFWTILVLVWAIALSSDLSLVSGQTVAPRTSSTVKPTSAPKLDVRPTKPMMIVNAPPNKQKHLVPVPLKSGMQVKDTKPLQVTGFITKSGNIYEIEDKRGMGSIEGRQADDSQDQIVCNYGNVVIYSDVPCDQVTNVRVGEIKPIRAGGSGGEQPAEVSTEKPQSQSQSQSQEEEQAPEKQEQEQEQEDGEKEQEQESNHPRGQQNQGANRRRRRRPQQQQKRRRGQGGNVQQRRRQQQQKQKQQRRRRQQPKRQRPQQQRLRVREENNEV
ncbi:putative cyclin-dependent serine/threonine-protein kinase DDB_G0272797/DDB_G0274007 [Drosophila miranda]|uniref:putative cyclin-dependent serine/threonine-protein kinase DDB_G0272797/DDB_G0274007 n=1 Tax=Drosophila miranda TaxID=7229 RepID=UPI0007E7B174|nr:putative cyclin-dependent serine/threonine-protein kinase DDB_G0272797/DDB_G0274007 [Drosophila miranda]